MNRQLEAEQTTGIAIVGMAGRFPMARDCAEFWTNLEAGRECLTRFTDEDLRAWGIDLKRMGSQSARARGVLSDADLFDASFFGLSPKEADMMDPQQRVFLEVAWEAIENAGYDHDRVPGAVAVFAGSGINTYFMSHVSARKDLLDRHGIFSTVVLNEKDFLATRLAYRLNLKGPAMTVQTACSTSLVAVCNACQSLLSFECDLALAGAAHIAFPRYESMVHAEGGMLSQDGHCRPFDKHASGTIFSDGVGAVLLKRLDDALADGDNVLAVIKGHAVNNDGSDKAGFTAPSVNGQAEVIQMAHAFGDIDPESITYLEAHGTATPLGDPIEIAALTKAFRAKTQAKQFCAIGSVKSNIGHLDVAAGIVGLIKTVLALQHGKIPPSINFDEANPEIDFASSPFCVADQLIDWRSTGPRRAGVSSFGIGGTNAHVVLEEAPQRSLSSPTRPCSLLFLSARTPSALEAAAQNLAEFLQANPTVNLGDVAYTLQQGRHKFPHRRVLVCRDVQQAMDSLRSNQGSHVTATSAQSRCSKVAFMFPGQGSQYVNMGRELYQREELFRSVIDHCAEILQPMLDLDLREVLYPEVSKTEWAEDLLGQTRITQPALFSTEYALARLWMSWGVWPYAMIGHSVGEYVAACLANVFVLPDALRLIAVRGRLIQNQPPGSMLAVMRHESEVRQYINDINGALSLAAVNAPTLCVVSGKTEQADQLQRALEKSDIASGYLQTSHAFHSEMMEAVIPAFTEVLGQIDFNAPELPFVSNVSGGWITDEEAMSPGYWTQHLRQAVLFQTGLGTILKEDGIGLVEVGPGRTLTTLARQHPAIDPEQLVASSLPAARDRVSSYVTMLKAVGQLWQAEMAIDWNAFYAPETRHRIPLPTYPFQRQRHWVDVPGRIEPDAHLQCAAPARSTTSATQTKSTGISTGQIPHSRHPATTDTVGHLVEILHDLSGIDRERLCVHSTFLEMGFDSIFLVQVARAIELRWGLQVTFRQLAEELASVNKLAAYIESKRPQISNSSSTPLELAAAGKVQETTVADSAALTQINERLDHLTSQINLLVGTIARVKGAQADSADQSCAATDQRLPFPLTDAQREIWMASQLNVDASCTYNESYLVELGGNLNRMALRDSIQQLINRHDALRCTFHDDGLQLSVTASLEAPWEYVDLSSMASFDTEELGLHRHVQQRVDQLFNLSTGPLARFVLFRLAERSHALLIVFHHIVVDGWSWGNLFRELGELYRAACEGRQAQLKPSTRYADYVRWTERPSQKEKANADARYWLDLFADKPKEIELPADHSRPINKTYQAGHLRVAFDESLTARLRDASQQHGCTLFDWLFTGFNVWLSKVTGREDLVVGVPMAGQLSNEFRRMRSFDRLVGHCVNMLPIRSRCDANISFAETLDRVCRTLLKAREHQQFTLGNLIQDLGVPRDASRVPVVSVSLNLLRSQTLDLGDLIANVERPLKSFNYFDLTIDVIDFTQSLTLDCKFNSDLFDCRTIQDWLLQFRHILEQAIANPNDLVRDLSLMDRDERHRVLLEWNATHVDYDRQATLHELIQRQAERTPEAVAAVFENTSVTYAELDRRANRLAAYLRERGGAGPDVRVGVCLERSLEMLVALLATLKSGAAYVPLDPSYPADRLAYILEDAQAETVITNQCELERLSQLNATIICLDRDRAAIDGCSQDRLNSLSRAEDLAYVIYTSGSTGRPKGVQIEHCSVVNFLQSMAQVPGLDADDVLLAVTTPAFDIAVLELFLPLLKGATVVVASRQTVVDARRMAKAIAANGVTVMQATPATWRMMRQGGWQGCSSLKILCGGEALPAELACELVPRCSELWNMYGPTETTVWSTCCRIDDADEIHIGTPIANTQIYILDKHLRPVPVGVPGELMIGGEGLARGYLDRPELTAEKFIANPYVKDEKIYRTGDLAKYRRDGTIECLGRVDYQVKIRGFRIELGEIESLLVALDDVKEAVAVASTDASGEKGLVAYVVAQDTEHPPTTEQLRKALRDKLPEYMVPSVFVVLRQMPRTANGKVDRNALPAPTGDRQTETRYVLPQNKLEQTIAGIWKKLLQVNQVGVHDNFFSLGGHSLLLVQVQRELEQIIDKDLSVTDLFRYPTIAALVEFLTNQGSGAMPTTEIQARGSRQKRAQLRARQWAKKRRPC